MIALIIRKFNFGPLCMICDELNSRCDFHWISETMKLPSWMYYFISIRPEAWIISHHKNFIRKNSIKVSLQWFHEYYASSMMSNQCLSKWFCFQCFRSHVFYVPQVNEIVNNFVSCFSFHWLLICDAPYLCILSYRFSLYLWK